MRIAIVVAGTVLSLAAAREATPATVRVGWSGFQTPSSNIVCNGSATRIDCVVFSLTHTCQQTWALRASGVPVHRCLFANIGTEVPVLPYGATVRSRTGMTCTSRRVGLTCRNARGHGFFLSRRSQRSF